jgi:acyl-CoA hydrolase/GNAT superfamily N-acetyltransferase
MDQWSARVRQRKLGAVQILHQILRDGMRIYIGSSCGEPQHLVDSLIKILPSYRDVEIIQNLSVGSIPTDWRHLAENARIKTFFVGPRTRNMVNDGLADYIPTYFSSIPHLFEKEPLWKIDIALVQVSPPDEHGFCSMGISVGVDKSAVETANIVIAQINREMPRTMGDSFLHLSQIQHSVEYDEPLIEIVIEQQSAVIERMAKYLSTLIEDGSTIQTGSGRVSNLILKYLDSKKDLGIHTEVLNDAHLQLIQSGVVTGQRKTLNRGKIVASFCLGTKPLYDFVNNNPEVEIHPTKYVNNRRVISRHDRMVAINSALEIDLSGQICADSLGHKVYSGIGGYVDFMHGASSSNGGKTIIVLPSTSPDGRRSRIVSHLADGAGVASPRSTVQYVVTEFGIAYLHGMTIRERALALINIAHPRFREQLLDEAKKIHYVFEDQLLPAIYEPLYPGQWETNQVFPPNVTLFFRPIKPTDERALQEFYYSLPLEAIYSRFFSAMKAFPHRNIQAMCNVDYEHMMAIIAVTGEIGAEKIIGIGRYILDQQTNFAEVDFAVLAEWQRKGIGSFLLDYLCEIAKTKGITGFNAYVLGSNRSMLSVFHASGYAVYTTLDEGLYDLKLRFDEPAPSCLTKEYE